jgi:hypothetical protein
VPTLVGTYNPVAPSRFGGWGVRVVGSIAYVAGENLNSGEPELDIVNVSNPTSPTELGSVTDNTSDTTDTGICVYGNYAYVVEDDGSLDVINISNPASPVIVGSASTPGTTRSVAVSADGHYVYVGGSGFLQVYDVSTPSAPALVSTYNLPGSGVALGLTVANGLVYAAAGPDGMMVFDPTDPTNLKLVASEQSTFGDFGVSVSGDLVYVAEGNGGLETLQLLDYVPPSVSITSPTSGSTFATNSGTISIGGTASDNVGVTQVVWSNDQGGGGTATGISNWSVDSIVLQPGDNDISVTAMDAAGNETSSTLTVDYTPVQSAQTITFAAPANDTFGNAPFGLSAVATSGLPVMFSVVSGPAILQDGLVTPTGAGPVVISASQAGNAFYSAAPTVTQSFTVTQANQTIAPVSISDIDFGVAPFTVDLAASSGLPVGLSVVSGPATVSGDVIAVTGVGAVVLQESQAGDTNYNPAANVEIDFNVLAAGQAISFGSLTAQTLGDAPFALNASASSGLPVGFSIVSGPATLAGSVLTITGVGTVTVQATQLGDADYNAATAMQQSFAVVPAPDVWTGTLSNSWSNPANWSSGQVPSSTTNVVVTNGTVVVSSPFTIGNLTVSGGLLQLASAVGTCTISSLMIAGTGALDLANNELIVNYGSNSDPISSIGGYLKSGFNGGGWNGSGIFSSAAAANSRYGLGYADGADGVVTGLPSGAIEIKYTLVGDADLDGSVTGSDFTALLIHLGKAVSGWDKGDFLYTGAVTGSDFTALVGNLGKTASGAAVASPIASLPSLILANSAAIQSGNNQSDGKTAKSLLATNVATPSVTVKTKQSHAPRHTH